MLHEHGFRCERTDDGEIRFFNPLGKEIGRTGDLPPVDADTTPREWLENELGSLDIGPETCVTRWTGERMDWNLAVGHLFDRRATSSPPASSGGNGGPDT